MEIGSYFQICEKKDVLQRVVWKNIEIQNLLVFLCKKHPLVLNDYSGNIGHYK